MKEINQEIVNKGKNAVQKLLKDIFKNYDTTVKSRLDRIEYKKSIYNSKAWLEKEIDNLGYSDLLSCMLDIEDEFEGIKDFIDEKLNQIDIFKQQYMDIQEDKTEEEEEEER
ncbi:hypothetical protein [uncultured Clostridium sp.]|jgi:hypothetical protein|uniref:hypothetical protein n=1 Tax=uncultured Clostridium sp. TaxID=59620 RepID=UPI00272AFD9B|nr:hypothetical protein [uncultured Clostridium sp.]